MSIDKSLKRKSGIVQVRSVLTRVERITKMMEEDKWKDGTSPYGIPKTRVLKVMLKKPKKAKVAEGEEGASPAAGATPAAAAGAKPAAAGAKAAASAPKKDEKKK
ncbi:MAG TPA: small basic protein [Gemmatales bacterium]|nr:small basic protein [Gemmatales bacterium]